MTETFLESGKFQG